VKTETAVKASKTGRTPKGNPNRTVHRAAAKESKHEHEHGHEQDSAVSTGEKKKKKKTTLRAPEKKGEPNTGGQRKGRDPEFNLDPTIKKSRTSSRYDGLEGFLLYVSDGAPADRGRSLKVTSKSVRVGRGNECELTLADDNVSRVHVRFSATSEGVEVEDLESTNGTFYLEKRIHRAVVGLGTRLRVGDTALDVLPLANARMLEAAKQDHYAELVGVSIPMRRLFSMLEALEASDAPVLIGGETGTGKELVARALHEKGLRGEQSFVVIDAGAVPANLIESELFGYKRGAFTGANQDRAGAFEAADGGTVFLDEIGELPLELQPKLLRVLESGQVKRIGDVHHRKVDVRILAATRRDLVSEIDAGRFRDDLFYRLAVVQIWIPPLRERPQDIPVLTRHLVRQITDGRLSRLAPEAEEYLMHQPWPGNVRELRNVLQRALALDMTGAEMLPQATRTPLGRPGATDVNAALEPLDARDERADRAALEGGPFTEAREAALLHFEKVYLTRIWEKAQGNVSQAARLAQIDRSYLRRLLKKHGLKS
jgi:DNA-binding NtrC family response regulator